jgi:hypothetical protein
VLVATASMAVDSQNGQTEGRKENTTTIVHE